MRGQPESHRGREPAGQSFIQIPQGQGNCLFSVNPGRINGRERRIFIVDDQAELRTAEDHRFCPAGSKRRDDVEDPVDRTVGKDPPGQLFKDGRMQKCPVFRFRD